MITDVDSLVTTAVTEVFTTMLNMPVRRDPPGTVIRNGEALVAGSVGFIGTLSGVVYIYWTARFARAMTGKMLGLTEKEVESEEMVNDAVGELANMVVGYMKSRFSDHGMPCVLTIPSIVRGSHFKVEGVTSTERTVMCFDIADGQQVVVEALIKPIKKN
ncbi:MAG: chemotaxis protein CheC [Verrucomicrobiales bacterium]|nr:chemotaxis protein CheC [Verrucomicrobiales bacterium]MDB6131140.1 chemotaxis protein CheC [Verrucomicrobiales bacterium]